ncbi:hypothetical protein LEADMMO150B3_24140 [Leclercia adecarboxylata]
MRNQLLINWDPFSSQGIYGSFYIYRIPQGDRRSQQCQTTGPVALILQPPISDLTQPVHKDRSCKRIAGLTFIQPSLYASAQ